MSMSPIFTVPETRAIGFVSCIRFRQRTKVLLPQPEGPISAVAWFAGMFRLMSCSVWLVPYHAFRLITSMPTPTYVYLLQFSSSGHSIASDSRKTTARKPLETASSQRNYCLARTLQHAAAGHIPHQRNGNHNQHNQHQRSTPGL